MRFFPPAQRVFPRSIRESQKNKKHEKPSTVKNSSFHFYFTCHNLAAMAAISADGAHRTSDKLDGQLSLNASRHAAGQKTLAAPAQGDTVASNNELTNKLKDAGIAQFAAPGKLDDLLRLCRDVFASLQPVQLNRDELTRIIREARTTVPESLAPTPSAPPKTFASLLKGQSSTSSIFPPPPPTATPRPQIDRLELIVHSRDTPAEIKGRSPKVVTAAINEAIKTNGKAVGVRKLPSGDTVVRFASPPSKAITDGDWVTAAFGTAASVQRKIYSVIMKGVPNTLCALDTASRLASLQNVENTISDAKTQVRRNCHYGMLILHVNDARVANKLCANGMAWKSMLFNCEPYCAAAQVTRCYNCHAYGHTSSFCKAKAKCGQCASDAHTEGIHCPRPKSEAKCLNCKGDHPVWYPDCPVLVKHREIAGAAYNARPLSFLIPTEAIFSQQPPTDSPTTATPAPSSTEEEYTLVSGRKRRALATPRRGRPTKAAQEAKRQLQNEITAMDLTPDANSI